MFYLQVFLVVLWLAISSTYGIIYSLLKWGNPNIDHDFARFFSWGVLKILRVQIEVEGAEYLEAHQPCIYVANHQSNIDLATFGFIYPRRTIVIGKKELLWIPFFGLFFIAAGNISIDRKKSIQALSGLLGVAKVIQKRGVSVWIFPEGTRNRKQEGLLPFKKGAFHLAYQAKVPIVPIVAGQLRPLISWEERRLKKGILKIKILPPVDTQKFKPNELDQLSKEVRERMLEALHGLET